MKFDAEKVAEAMREVAEAEILPRWKRLGVGEIVEKTGPDDIVTVADRAAEQALSKRLLQLYPGTEIVGEESVAADPARMDLFFSGKPVWVIDPIDGTSAFAEGSPQFDIMIALVQGKELLAGWIYAPVDKMMIMGAKGAGVTRDNEKLKPARAGAAVQELAGIIGKKFFPEDLCKKIMGRANNVGKLSYTICAGHDYTRLLSGVADFALYNKTMPWDHLPGLAMAQELGFTWAKWDGTPYLPGNHTGGLLVAPDKTAWQEINTLLLSSK